MRSNPLYEGMAYRHVVLTVPDSIRMPFFHDRSLLAALMKCGVQMLGEALSWFKKRPLEAGYVVVLETGGRAGNWNPHLHILMTSGGVTQQNRWLEVGYFPYEVLHKKWQYHLLTMLKERVGTPEMTQQIDALWQKYPNGLVAYLEEGKVPAGGQGLAYYLAKYTIRNRQHHMTIGHPFIERPANVTHPLIDIHLAARQTKTTLAAKRDPLLFQAVFTPIGAIAGSRIATAQHLLHHLRNRSAQVVTTGLPEHLPMIAEELFEGLFVDTGCWGLHKEYQYHSRAAESTPTSPSQRHSHSSCSP